VSASVRLSAAAKLNLELRILAREVDGYHQLESVFIGVSLADTLTLVANEDGEVRLEVVGDAGGVTGKQNLVYRAVRSFLDRFGNEMDGVDATLEKIVPVAAGLGGGSADAAAALRGMAELWPGRSSGHDLLELASELGADVPFFLAPSPYALAWGRGGRLLGLRPPPSRPVLIAVPAEGVATVDAYRQVAAQGRPRAGQPIYHTLDRWADWPELAAGRVNDFEAVLYPVRPDLEALGTRMRSTGPMMSGMTGSGAAHYAVYSDSATRSAAREQLELDPDLRVFEAMTLSEWPAPTVERGPHRS